MSVEAPSPPATPPVTQQAVQGAVQALLDQQAAADEKRLSDALDIQDPGKQPNPVLAALATEPPPQGGGSTAPAATPPNVSVAGTIAGVVADGLTESLLDRAAGVGINEARARVLGADGVRDILAHIPKPQPPTSTPQFKFDPMTGAALGPQPADDIPELGDPTDTILDPVTGESRPAEYDPQVKAVINAQAKALRETRDKLAKIEANAEQARVRAQTSRDQNDYATLEKCIADDAPLKAVLGEGPGHRLVGTAAHDERHKLARAVDALVHNGLAKTVPDAYQMARRALHGDRLTATAEAAAQEAVYAKARDAQGRFLPKPTATERSDDLPKGPARALRTLERMLRAQPNA